MPGAVDQADRIRRIFMQHGYARIVEALRSSDACGEQRMSLDEGTADQTMRDDHQRAAHAAAPAHDEAECICDARVKCWPIFSVRWREVRPKRIFSQLGIRHTAQIAKV